MGLFYRTDGLTSYYSSNSGDIKERSHTTAYTAAGSTVEHTATDIYGDITNTAYPQFTGIWLSSDGTKLYLLWTNYEGSDSDDGYMEQFSLSTAWDLSTINHTPVTTLTLPKGTEYPSYPTTGTALYSDHTTWQGLEFADDGLSFYFLRWEADEYTSEDGRDNVTFKVDYTLTTAWNLSTASLSSTTKIAISESFGYSNGYCSMYHTMSGGEIVVAKYNEFLQIDSISDTTANFTSNLASNLGYWFSEDETLLLGNDAYVCFNGHTKIDTNYVQSTSNELDLASSGTHVDITNESTTSQNITYEWKYVSYSGNKPNVQYLGVNRSTGYRTPALTSAFSTDNYPPFLVTAGSGGGGQAVLRMTVISATVDTIDELDAHRDIQINVL